MEFGGKKTEIARIIIRSPSRRRSACSLYFKGGPACDLSQNLPTLKNKRRYLFRTQRDLTFSLELSSPQPLSSNDAIITRSSNATKLHERKVNLTDAGQEFLFNKGLNFRFDFQQSDGIHCQWHCGRCTRPWWFTSTRDKFYVLRARQRST